jgi:hypothetical protein
MLRMLDRKSIDPAHHAAGRKKPPAVTGGTRVPHQMKLLARLPSSFFPPTVSSLPRLSVYELLSTGAVSGHPACRMLLACRVCAGCLEGLQWPDLIDLVRLPIPR